MALYAIIIANNYMTIWDNIYKNYKQGGEAYATLRKGLIPEFLSQLNC